MEDKTLKLSSWTRAENSQSRGRTEQMGMEWNRKSRAELASLRRALLQGQFSHLTAVPFHNSAVS